ncbi:MAG TPA: DUF309 domain-containing protein [Actinomycetota bacterium]|nr:DUF309 domain-containing protein [Actinomycetota bacterium]HNO15833.1 DUF309 domain-containing protein [Actinomycetota bacterium]HUM86976.1 DUF309 domain-containing protein [Actinomycetota bacterium]
MTSRDRDPAGRPLNARARDALGRPLPPGAQGVPPLPDDIDPSPESVVVLADRLLDEGLPFQAHEVLEAAWKACPDAERAAWQGMAQLAVALTHASRGNDSGARRLRQRAEGNLAAGGLPPVAADLRDRLRRMCDAAGAYRTG